jgi:hypothetical protein
LKLTKITWQNYQRRKLVALGLAPSSDKVELRRLAEWAYANHPITRRRKRYEDKIKTN